LDLKKNMKTISGTTAPARVSMAGTSEQPAGLAGHIHSSLAAGNASAAKTAAPTKARIKVMLVDDHPVVRKGVSSCLSRHEHLQIVAEASDGREAVAKARQLLPNVILMDIDMPHMNGLAVTELLRKELPEIKVLILSMHSNTDYVMRIIQSGARGYVLKEAPTEELVRAVDAVHSGEAFFSPEVAHAALNQFVRGVSNQGNEANLTAREREVLVQIAEGLSNMEIAGRLGVGVRTVETHRERIMRKLDIHSVAGLTKFAISRGLVSLRT